MHNTYAAAKGKGKAYAALPDQERKERRKNLVTSEPNQRGREGENPLTSLRKSGWGEGKRGNGLIAPVGQGIDRGKGVKRCYLHGIDRSKTQKKGMKEKAFYLIAFALPRRLSQKNIVTGPGKFWERRGEGKKKKKGPKHTPQGVVETT